MTDGSRFCPTEEGWTIKYKLETESGQVWTRRINWKIIKVWKTCKLLKLTYKEKNFFLLYLKQVKIILEINKKVKTINKCG